MIDKALNLLAPHHCCGCQKIGALLCDDCNHALGQSHDNAFVLRRLADYLDTHRTQSVIPEQ